MHKILFGTLAAVTTVEAQLNSLEFTDELA
jgi:hypothetical protein